jgi:hypothetical protein
MTREAAAQDAVALAAQLDAETLFHWLHAVEADFASLRVEAVVVLTALDQKGALPEAQPEPGEVLAVPAPERVRSLPRQRRRRRGR